MMGAASCAGEPPRRLLRFMAAASIAFWGGWASNYISTWGGNPYDLFGDYFMLWSSGRLLLERGVDALYSAADYVAFQHQFRAPSEGWYPPPPYPPVFLAVVQSLARLPYLAGVALWLSLTFALHALALPRKGWCTAFLMLALAPATAINVIAGHNGLFSGGLAMAGFTLLSAHPLAAGVMFGLLSYKPQMFLLLPLALLAARQWRALAATLVTAGMMVLAGIALYGWGVTWHVATYLGQYSDLIETDVANLSRLMPTIMPAMLKWGAPHGVAVAVQGVVAAAALAALWHSCRRGITPAAVAVWSAATFLVTPYAMVYDLCLLTVGLIFLRGDWSLRPGEAVVLPLVWALPVYGPMLVDGGWPVMPLVLLAFLVVALRRLPAQGAGEMPLPCPGQ